MKAKDGRHARINGFSLHNIRVVRWGRKMKRTFSYNASLGTLFLALAGGFNATLAQAQAPCNSVPAKTTTCKCGQWTCPACQQRCNCPPAGQSTLPGSIPSMSQPLPGGDQSLLQSPPTVAPAPGQSASEQAAALAAGLDSSQFNPQSRGQSDQLAGRSSDNFSSAIEFQGDNFGTASGLSTVTQLFQYDGLLGDSYSNGYAFDVPTSNISQTDDIYIDGTPNSANANQVFGVLEPTGPSEAARPTGTGNTFAGGTATQATSDPTGPYNIRYAYTSRILIPSSVTGRMKLAENVSPIPRNRLFFNYSSFNNVPLTPQGITVNRFTPGFEKTFFGKLASVEVRTPFASTLDSNIFSDGITNTSKAEFGNVFLAFKGILLASNSWAISSGMSLSLPTADDNRVFSRDGTELVRVKNQSVHVMPFIGGVITPTSKFFLQGILQVDIDSNGNDVLTQDINANGQNTLQKIGRFQDSTLLYTDVGIGYWIMRRGPRDQSFLRGIIPTLEGHYNRSLNDADCVTGSISSGGITIPTTVIQPVIKQLDVVNMVGGCAFQFRNNSRMSIGYAAPLGSNNDRTFDGEWRATWNKFY